VSAGLDEAVFAVVGGTSPFGLAVARELVEKGARVLLVGPELEPVEHAAEELGDRAFPCVADLADPADIARVGAVAVSFLGRVDGMLVDATPPVLGDVLDVTDEAWLTTFRRIVLGTLALIRGIVPLLESEGGSIVVVTGAPGQRGHAADVLRAALEVVVQSIAHTLAPAIRVNRVEPALELVHEAALLLAPVAAP
jgi:3-oxoacyl-[acyl-carrier protein] reductase